MRGLIYNLELQKGEVLGYATHCLASLRPDFDRIWVVTNGAPDSDGLAELNACSDEVVVLDKQPRDHIRGYLGCISQLGLDQIQALDELTLMDCDLIGPVYPYEAMRASMAAQSDLDFWSIASRKDEALSENDRQLVSIFLTLGQNVLQSEPFHKFLQKHTPRKGSPGNKPGTTPDLAAYLIKHDFKGGAFIKPEDYETDHPLLLEIKETLEDAQCPFILLHPFYSSPALQDAYQINLDRIIPYLEENSTYPTNLMWQVLLKTTSLRSLHTNLAYQFTFDSKSYEGTPKWDPSLKIAACAHLYYTEAFEEIFDRVSNIPHPFDFYITTASDEKKAILEEKCAAAGIEADVRVVGENRGRDMSSLYIDLKDVVMEKDYDLVCRLHSKKSPQVHPTTGKYFKNFIFDSVLANREYVSHLLDFFATHQHVGMAFAPMIHTGYRSMGHAWYDNRPIFAEILEDLNCSVPEEPYSPLAAYGTVYWFRPDALRPMFDDQYQYSQYNQEPNHVDGGLAHGQERAMTYVAQARGYMSATVWPDYVAAQSTTLMEYKMDSLYSYFPMEHVAPHGHLISYVNGETHRSRTPSTLRQFERFCRPALKSVGAALGIKRQKKNKHRDLSQFQK